MRTLALFGVVALALASAAAGATRSGGLRGVVKEGPTSPVCVQDTPCDGLARGVTLVFTRAGHSARRVTTRTDGSYRIGLAAGRYAVRMASADGIGRVSPSHVAVPSGRYAHVNFVFDTGIRAP